MEISKFFLLVNMPTSSIVHQFTDLLYSLKIIFFAVMREDLSQVLDQVRKVANETVPQGGRVFLFGSRARGDFRADSDWDFLVILQKDRIEKSDYDSVIYPLTLLGWKLGLDFVPVIYTENDWNNRKGTLFYHNVQTDSIKII